MIIRVVLVTVLVARNSFFLNSVCDLISEMPEVLEQLRTVALIILNILFYVK